MPAWRGSANVTAEAWPLSARTASEDVRNTLPAIPVRPQQMEDERLRQHYEHTQSSVHQQAEPDQQQDVQWAEDLFRFTNMTSREVRVRTGCSSSRQDPPWLPIKEGDILVAVGRGNPCEEAAFCVRLGMGILEEGAVLCHNLEWRGNYEFILELESVRAGVDIGILGHVDSEGSLCIDGIRPESLVSHWNQQQAARNRTRDIVRKDDRLLFLNNGFLPWHMLNGISELSQRGGTIQACVRRDPGRSSQ